MVYSTKFSIFLELFDNQDKSIIEIKLIAIIVIVAIFIIEIIVITVCYRKPINNNKVVIYFLVIVSRQLS